MFRDYSDCSEELKEEIRRIKFKPYYEIANELNKAIKTISNTCESQIIRWAYIKQLKLELTALLYDRRLDEFTKTYKDTKPSTKVNVGYDHNAVARFVTQMMLQFPHVDPTSKLYNDVLAHIDDMRHDLSVLRESNDSYNNLILEYSKIYNLLTDLLHKDCHNNVLKNHSNIVKDIQYSDLLLNKILELAKKHGESINKFYYHYIPEKQKEITGLNN